MSDRIKVLIVDDIPETRDHLSKLLGFEADVEVVGAAPGGPEAIQMAASVKPDVVLMDINMPGMLMSIRTTSGLTEAAIWMASGPPGAAPTTSTSASKPSSFER